MKAAMVPFDDGHVPPNFRSKKTVPIDSKCDGEEHFRDCPPPTNNPSTSTAPCYIVKHQEKCAPRCLEVYEDVLDETLASRIYDYTVDRRNGGKGPSAWGTYVTMEQILQSAQSRKDNVRNGRGGLEDDNRRNGLEDAKRGDDDDVDDDGGDIQGTLALEASSQFLVERDGANKLIHQDIENGMIHGVSVWALCSDVGSEVEYHIDYAELIRYESNVIYPPLYAGTIQCTKPLSTKNGGDGEGRMVGGDFVVHTGGLDHYECHGYKGKKRRIDDLPTPFPSSTSNDQGDGDDTSYSGKWETIRYKFNQGILHDGDFPHCSTKVEYLPHTRKRVVMGFNLFSHDCGPRVQMAPEHSAKFNRRIKMYQAVNARKNGQGGRLTVEAVRRNKPLAKLLVLAKRERLKSQFRARQVALTEDIARILREEEGGELTVTQLMDRICGGSAFSSPFPSSGGGEYWHRTDVHVHINSIVGDGGDSSSKLGIEIVGLDDKQGGAGGDDTKNCHNRTLISESARLRVVASTEGK